MAKTFKTKGILIAPVLMENADGEYICFPKNCCVTVMASEADYSDVSPADLQEAVEILEMSDLIEEVDIEGMFDEEE